MPVYVTLLIILALLTLPFLLGGSLARSWRMPDYGWKFGLIFFALAASAVVIAFGWPPRLGIDLSGGVFLVYEVDPEQTKHALGSEELGKLVTAVSMRVNPSGVKEVTIRPRGSDQIEIIIPTTSDQQGQEEAKRIERIISQAGSLEFRILANKKDHAALIERAEAETAKAEKENRHPPTQVKDEQGKLLGWWVPVHEGKTPSELLAYSQIAKRTVKEHGREVHQILVVKDDFDVTGGFLTQAKPGQDRRGQPAVDFFFNDEGAQRFGGLTGSNLPDTVGDFKRNLAIILDGELHSAPSINSTITDRGIIEGSFTQAAVQDLVNVLNAGSLPTALAKEPISRLISGATLGEDTIRKGTLAMIISSILVPLFMIWYYRFCGMVAIVALALNMLMLLAVMIAVGARFTLTGLAGLALTIGMAVDNNVLIYERLREEIGRGATLRMAIRNAFHRAGAVIIDTNTTHMIAAAVLLWRGTEQVKGFAVTFLLGAAISLFTAVFVARVIFEVAERQHWLTQARMLKLIGHTSIDFMGWFPVCGTASLLITVLGLAVAGVRGPGLFDIDFTGGVSVEALFRQQQDIGQIRHLLRDLPDVAVSGVQVQGEEPGVRFVINTSEANRVKVEETLAKVFGDRLISNSVELKDLSAIAADKQALEPAAERETPEKASTEKTPQPDAGKQTRRDLPPENVLALAEPLPWILAQAESPQGKSDAGDEPPKQNAAENPAAQPAGKPAAEQPSQAGAEKPAENSAAEPSAKPAEKTPEKPAEAPAEKPAERSPGQATAEEKPAAALDPFAGGTRARLEFLLTINYEAVKDLLSAAMKSQGINPEAMRFQLGNDQYVDGDSKAYPWWDVRIQLPRQQAEAVFAVAKKQLTEKPFFPASSRIGGAVASDTRVRAIQALCASWLLIILYLWIRFQKVAFGVAAVIALIHDVLVMLAAVAASYYLAPYLGFLMIEPFKINLPIVAAFLTIIGYSVNDTIVIFDRIREVRGKDPNLTRQMVNDSTNQTLSRTLLTSFTVLLVVVVLYFFGGDALHGFAFSLLIGVITGTYSSIYVAAPILLWMIHRPKRLTALAK
jgi:SecD/SecF fusion protein